MGCLKSNSAHLSTDFSHATILRVLVVGPFSPRGAAEAFT